MCQGLAFLEAVFKEKKKVVLLPKTCSVLAGSWKSRVSGDRSPGLCLSRVFNFPVAQFTITKKYLVISSTVQHLIHSCY